MAGRRGKDSRYANATYTPPQPRAGSKGAGRPPTQLDYICVSRRWRSAVKNVNVCWGVSKLRWPRHRQDHALLECELALRVRQPAKTQAEPNWKALTDERVAARLDAAIQQACGATQPTTVVRERAWISAATKQDEFKAAGSKCRASNSTFVLQWSHAERLEQRGKMPVPRPGYDPISRRMTHASMHASALGEQGTGVPFRIRL